MKRDKSEIFVFGSNGMLGRYVHKYLQLKMENYEVVPLTRADFDVNDKEKEEIKDFLLSRIKSDRSNQVVINCAGVIKPMVEKVGEGVTMNINSFFPQNLGLACYDLGLSAVHVTTDCIYGGLQGNYIEDKECIFLQDKATDMYGSSKNYGDCNQMSTIRTSIIGEEVKNGRSLVEWVKSQNGSSVNGFINHYWNGITCLEFAKILEKMINSNKFWPGKTQHVHSNTVTKYELIKMIVDTYGLNIKVEPTLADTRIDRTLDTVDRKLLRDMKIPTIQKQIEEMKNFGDDLKS